MTALSTNSFPTRKKILEKLIEETTSFRDIIDPTKLPVKTSSS